jgi:hypothetical protein
MGEHPRQSEASDDDVETMINGYLRKDFVAKLDSLITEAKNQMQHNGPVSPSIVNQLEAIRALVG